MTVSLALLFAGWAAIQGPPAAPTVRLIAAEDRLIQASDLVYQGSFRLPQGTFGGSSFAYGGSALAFYSEHSSLFMVGHPWQQMVAEVAIPALGDTATVLQPFVDVTEGRMLSVGTNPVSDNPQVGGLLPYQGKLIASVFLYYDGTAGQIRSHFVSGLDLSVLGDVAGPFQIGAYNQVVGQNTAGFVDGWMVLVPAAWQAALGGPILAGQCCLPIISRTSLGPAAFAIDPAQLSLTDPLPALPLLYYTGQHVLPDQNGVSLANVTTQMGGAVFPAGTRSLMFFGRIGLGPYCYGEVPKDCIDPAEGSKGPHMFPYTYFVWAYDVADLAKVKAGQIQPWDVRPYATWPLVLPEPPVVLDEVIQGVTIDQATNRIFLSQYHGDGDNPLILVYGVKP